MSADNTLSNILKDLKNIKQHFDVFIPSKNTSVKVSPLSVSQQKQIMEISVSDVDALINFNKVIYSILKENVQGDVGGYTTVDRVAICIALRKQMSDTLSLTDKTINLKDVAVSNTQYQAITRLTTNSEIAFEIAQPDLARDVKINNYISKQIKPGDDFKSIVSWLYVAEVVKFIKKLTILQTSTVVDFYTIDQQTAFAIVNDLPSGIIKDVLAVINNVRDQERELCKVAGTEDTYIDISPELFIM